MTLKEIETRASEIIETLDKEKYPEIYDYLSDLIDDSEWFESVMDFAEKIHNADGKNILPKEVANLLFDIYADEAKNDKTGGAFCNLGSLFYTGRCGKQNFKLACEYYEKAAKFGCRQAEENLGYCYYYGRTGEIDYKKAYHYFIKGALDNHLNSLYKIGDMYKNGYYVEKDEKEAFNIYRHCLYGIDEDNVDLVGADIYIRVADCYYNGTGTDKDLNLALDYYKRAEGLYFKRLQTGDFMYKKQLERSIEMQEKVRKELLQSLPKYDWTK